MHPPTASLPSGFEPNSGYDDAQCCNSVFPMKTIDLSRFEIMPFGKGEVEAAALPEPTRLTVTCSPTYGIDQTVGLAKRLRTLGHAVTVHLAARMVRDRMHLDKVLTDL